MQPKSDAQYDFAEYCNYILRRQGIFIALATSLLYLMAQSYLQSYLKFFGASHYWFDTSLSRLVSFSIVGVGCSLLFVVYYGILQVLAYRHRRVWIIAFVVWCLSLSALASLYGFARIAGFAGTVRVNIAVVSLAALVWMVVPLVSFVRSGKFAKHAGAIPDLEKQMRKSLIAEHFSVSLPLELEKERVAQSISRAKFLATPWILYKKSLGAWVLMTLGYLWQMWYLAGVCGWVAAMFFWAGVERVDRDSQGVVLPDRLVFTDAKHALIGAWSGAERDYFIVLSSSDEARFEVKPDGKASIEARLVHLDKVRAELERAQIELEELRKKIETIELSNPN